MAQPTLETVTADPGSLGATFKTERVGSDDVPVSLISFSTGDGTIDVVTDSGESLPVTIDADALASLAKLDNIAHAGGDVALVEHVPISGQFDDVATGTVTENQVAPVRITAARALHVEMQGTAIVDGSGVTQPISAASLPLPALASTAANQLPNGHDVTIDNASGASAVNIQDGGNSITVDSPSLSTIAGAVVGTEMQVDLVSANVTNAGTFTVQMDGDALAALQIIDNPVLVEDVAFAGGSVMMCGAVRDDSLTTLTPADGDAVPLRVNSTGALHVTGAGGGTQFNVDDAAGGTDTGTLVLVVRDDSLTTLTPADGDYAALRVNATGALHVTGGGGGTEYVVNAVAPGTPTGTSSLMERDDALGGLSPVEGDWSHMFCDANGALWVKTSGNTAITAASLPLPAGAAESGNQLAAGHDVTPLGNVAHDAADSGNPIKTGGRARIEDDVLAADNDRVDAYYDTAGRLIVSKVPVEELLDGTASSTGTADTSIIAAQGAGFRIYLTTLIISNESATISAVMIKSAATTRQRVPAPINGGAVIHFDPPLRLGANEALQFASVTGVSTMYVSAVGYKGR